MGPTLVAGGLFGVPAVVEGQIPPQQAQTVPADIPLGGGTHLDVSATANGTRFVLRVGSRDADVFEVPIAVGSFTLEETTTGARPIVLVRAEGGTARVAAVLDLHPRPHVAWHGRLDLHGDPGERVADALEMRDVDGDGRPELVLGERREGISACGEPPQLLFAHALDGRGRLRPVEPIPSAEGLTSLAAVAGEARPAPVVRALRFTGASSQRGTEERAVALGPPFGLTDGDAATGWSEGRGAGGRGEVVRAQWSGPPIVGLELRALAPLRMPRLIFVRTDDARFAVTVPEDASERAWIALPSPTRTACLSVMLADPAALPADAQVGFSEVTAYSVADLEGGVSSLIDLLVADAADGDRAVGWLAATGPDVIAALDASWERLAGRGRRRALRVAGALERSATEATRHEIRALRSRAVGDDDPDVRGDAITALARGNDDDRLALLEGAMAEPAGTPLAAAALAHGRGLPASARPLVARFDHAHWDRAPLRAAVAHALVRDPAWQGAFDDVDLDTYALAALGLALAEATASGAVGDEGATIAAAIVERAIAAPPSTETSPNDVFVTRYRLARAARVVHRDAVDAWLDGLARTAEEWMLRAEAVDALGERASRDLLAVLLHDAYPRVRLAAARSVARRGGEQPTLLALARHDGWPLVRAYALGEIADVAEGRAALLEALRDPASAMRARALDLLRTRAAPDVDAAVAQILEDDQEWPHVAARAVELADVRCTDALGPALVHAVARGARPSASAGDLETAQLALRTALRMGGATAEQARSATRGPSAPAFEVLLAHPQPPCGPTAPGDARGVPSAT